MHLAKMSHTSKISKEKENVDQCLDRRGEERREKERGGQERREKRGERRKKLGNYLKNR